MSGFPVYRLKFDIVWIKNILRFTFASVDTFARIESFAFHRSVQLIEQHDTSRLLPHEIRSPYDMLRVRHLSKLPELNAPRKIIISWSRNGSTCGCAVDGIDAIDVHVAPIKSEHNFVRIIIIPFDLVGTSQTFALFVQFSRQVSSGNTEKSISVLAASVRPPSQSLCRRNRRTRQISNMKPM